MTLWQFYAVFFVICVVGVGVCAAMYWAGARCPMLGCKRDTWAQRVRNKLMIVFLALAAIASFGTLEDITNAFTYDASEAVGELAGDLTTRAIQGEDITRDLGELAHVELPREGDVIWGEYDESQRMTLYLITGFWYFLSWMIYLGNFAKSPSSWWQKLCKIVAYPLITSFILLFPLDVHYFSRDELMPPLVMLAIAGVLVLVSHDRTPRPPALPGTENA